MIVEAIIISTFFFFIPAPCMELTPHKNTNTPPQTKAEWSPVFVAIFSQNKQEIKQLIKNGIDINECSSFSTKTPLHEAVVLSSAITKTLLKNGATVNALDSTGQTPLHICMDFFNTHKSIELLLHYKADINIQTHKGKTALHKAVKNGDIKKIHLLLAHNADVSITTHKGKTALDYAQKINVPHEQINAIIAALESKVTDK